MAMKNLLVFLLFIASCAQAEAQQIPQFIRNSAPFYSASLQFGNRLGTWRQDLHYPSDFPTAPAGHITRLYFQAKSPLANSMHIANLLIKMGYMSPGEDGDSMHLNSTAPVSFYPTDTVLFSSNYFVDTPVGIGDWVGFTLQTPFYYNAYKNFIVEMHVDSLDVFYGFQTNAISGLVFRNYSRSKNASGAWNPVSVTGAVHYIGFDILPNDVKNIQNISSFVLYPNPSEGRLNISLEAKQTIREMQITITDMTGSVVSQQQYRNVQGSFLKQVDLANLPRGLYLAELKADGEKITKKLVLQ